MFPIPEDPPYVLLSRPEQLRNFGPVAVKELGLPLDLSRELFQSQLCIVELRHQGLQSVHLMLGDFRVQFWISESGRSEGTTNRFDVVVRVEELVSHRS